MFLDELAHLTVDHVDASFLDKTSNLFELLWGEVVVAGHHLQCSLVGPLLQATSDRQDAGESPAIRSLPSGVCFGPAPSPLAGT